MTVTLLIEDIFLQTGKGAAIMQDSRGPVFGENLSLSFFRKEEGRGEGRHGGQTVL